MPQTATRWVRRGWFSVTHKFKDNFREFRFVRDTEGSEEDGKVFDIARREAHRHRITVSKQATAVALWYLQLSRTTTVRLVEKKMF